MKHQLPLTNDINLCITENPNGKLKLSLFSNPLEITFDENMKKEDLIRFSEELAKIVNNLVTERANYYVYDYNADLYWSKKRQQYVPSKELSYDDGMTLLEVEDFVEYCPNLSIKIKVQTFSKKIGDIIHPFIQLNGTQFYADVQDSQAIDKDQIIEGLSSYEKPGWSWILQSSAISFFLNYNPEG